VGQRCDILMSKDGDAVARTRMQVAGILMRLLGVLQGLAGVFMSRLVVLFVMGFRSIAMNVGGIVVQLRCPLMIFVVRSVVVASRHLETLHPARFVVSFLGELVSSIGIFQGPLRVPVAGLVIAFFVVFRGSAMRLSS
jgi:hypothetical protein